MKSERAGFDPEASRRAEIVETQGRIKQVLFDLRNDLTNSPIDLPHRNTLRDLLSSAYHLVEVLGTEESRVEEVRQKLARILESLSRQR